MRAFRYIVCLIFVVALSSCSFSCRSERAVCGDSIDHYIGEKDAVDIYREQHHNTAIVVIHGMNESAENMDTLVHAMRYPHKYAVLNIGYPARYLKLPDLVRVALEQIKLKIAYINQDLEKKNQIKTVHLVGYSLGGVVSLDILLNHSSDLAKLGVKIDKLVQIGSPDCGTRVADVLNNLIPGISKEIGGPVISDLKQSYRSAICRHMNLSKHTVGSIAGSTTHGTFEEDVGHMILNTPNDGAVPVKNTIIQGMKDHLTLPYSHCQLKNSRVVYANILCFLEHGKFCHIKNVDK